MFVELFLHSTLKHTCTHIHLFHGHKASISLAGDFFVFFIVANKMKCQREINFSNSLFGILRIFLSSFVRSYCYCFYYYFQFFFCCAHHPLLSFLVLIVFLLFCFACLQLHVTWLSYIPVCSTSFPFVNVIVAVVVCC